MKNLYVLILLVFSTNIYSQKLREYPFTKAKFCITKEKNDAKMCVTGAFTSYLGGIVGDYAVNGKQYIGKEPKKNKELGIICFHSREIDIYPANCNVKANNYFHQICLVKGRSIKVKYNPSDYKTLRRAIGLKLCGKKYLVECDNVTLYEFAKLLYKHNYISAIYTDCGAWDYGWIKINGKKKRLGYSSTLDKDFTNYVYFW